jgi:hypothetical protein
MRTKEENDRKKRMTGRIKIRRIGRDKKKSRNVKMNKLGSINSKRKNR